MRVRDEGRVIVFGITPLREVIAFACFKDHPIAQEIHQRDDLQENGVFIELPVGDEGRSSRSILIERLTEIYQKHWIASQKLGKDGVPQAYKARNGGGYTLEAELGISPNGYAEPDYLGWEIKQYGVSDFKNFRPKSPVTLMTPEPTQGVYRDKGIVDFMERYSYADKSGKQGRRNFCGVYACGKTFHKDTGLRLDLAGFDAETGKITDVDGGLVLLDQNEELAAKWPFSGMIEHWNRKHAQAAYIPSLFRTPPPEYSYGPSILLCEKTDFGLFLEGVSKGKIYYDPAVKIEAVGDGSSKIKKRNQFRVRHVDLESVYYRTERVSLLN